jgi:hypothetical protein
MGSSETTLLGKIQDGVKRMVSDFMELPIKLIGWVMDSLLGLFGINIEGGMASKLMSWLDTAMDVFFGVLGVYFDVLVGIGKVVGKLLGAMMDIVLSPFIMIIDTFKILGKAIGWTAFKIYETWNTVTAFFGKIWGAVSGVLGTIWEGIKSIGPQLWEGIKSIGPQLLESLKSIAGMFVDSLKEMAGKLNPMNWFGGDDEEEPVKKEQEKSPGSPSTEGSLTGQYDSAGYDKEGYNKEGYYDIEGGQARSKGDGNYYGIDTELPTSLTEPVKRLSYREQQKEDFKKKTEARGPGTFKGEGYDPDKFAAPSLMGVVPPTPPNEDEFLEQWEKDLLGKLDQMEAAGVNKGTFKEGKLILPSISDVQTEENISSPVSDGSNGISSIDNDINTLSAKKQDEQIKTQKDLIGSVKSVAGSVRQSIQNMNTNSTNQTSSISGLMSSMSNNTTTGSKEKSQIPTDIEQIALLLMNKSWGY